MSRILFGGARSSPIRHDSRSTRNERKCICVYMYVCIYIYIYISIYIYIYIIERQREYIYIYIYIYIHTHIRYIQIYVYIYIYTHREREICAWRSGNPHPSSSAPRRSFCGTVKRIRSTPRQAGFRCASWAVYFTHALYTARCTTSPIHYTTSVIHYIYIYIYIYTYVCIYIYMSCIYIYI